MTKRGGWNDESRSLNSIRLEDFPENEELASSYFDWEYDSRADFDDDDEDDEVVVMKKADFLAEEDFLEKSMKMLDDEEDLASDETKDDGLEDFTLKLDPSLFDLSESEMEAAASLRNSVFELELGEEDEDEPAPEPEPAPEIPASEEDMAPRNRQPDKPVSHSSVARLFAAESEETEKTAKSSGRASASKQTKKPASGSKAASQSKTASQSRSSSQSKSASQGRSTSQSRSSSEGRSTSQNRTPSQSRSDSVSRSGSSSGSRSQSRSLNSGTQISRSPAPKTSSNNGRTRASSGSSSAKRSSSSSAGRSRSNARPKKKTPIGLKIAKFFIFLILWIAVGVVCYKGYQFAYNVFYDVPMDAADVSKIEFTVTGSETDEEVGEKLEDLGLIDDMKVFLLRCKLYKAKYVAGTYKLSRSFNTEKILNILAAYDYATGTMEDDEPETTQASEEGQESTDQAGEGGEDQENDGDQDDGGED